jgi:glycosyltransferase 2 family protein
MHALSVATKRDASRAWLLLALRWATALLILAALAHFLPVAQLRSALLSVPPARFAAMLALYLVALLGGATKWHLVVNSAGSRLPFAVSAQCYAGGLFGALFLPSIVGGDVVRLAVGISRSRRPASVITGNVVDRILDVGAQLTLVVLGLVLLPQPLPRIFRPAPRYLLPAVLAGAALLVVLVIALPQLLRGRSFRFRRKLAQIDLAKRAIFARPCRIFLCWLLGVSVQGTFLVVAMVFGAACGLHLPLCAWLFAWPLSKIAGILPITQGGIGVRETALVALLAPLGAPAAQVLATGIASEGVIISGGLIAGLSAFLLRRRDSLVKQRGNAGALKEFETRELSRP